MRRMAMITTMVLVILALLALPVRADCPGNLLRNPGFEEGNYHGPTVGASLSSYISNHWYPWAVLGDPSRVEPGYNHEPEYKILIRSQLHDGWYRVFEGERAQGLFTTWSTHTAGLYQQVSVPPGTRVTFSVWTQIYTGQEDIIIEGRYPVSDLEQPLTEATRAVKGPGDYRVSIGIDPYGDAPAGFGGALPDTIAWSDPVLDIETRSYDDQGRPVDEWVRLSVSTIAESDQVTVFTRGQPDFRTKYNDSYWDAACLVAQAVQTLTPTPTQTPVPSPTLRPTLTPLPTALPTPTPTTVPTMAPPPMPSATETSVPTVMPATMTIATATQEPIAMVIPATPDLPPTAAPLVVDREVEAMWLAEQGAATIQAPAEQARVERSSVGLTLLYILNGLFVFAVIYWIRRERR
jgi:hypothetical protein